MSRVPSVVTTRSGIGGAWRYTSRPKKPRMKNAAKSAAPNSTHRRRWLGSWSDSVDMGGSVSRLRCERATEEHVVLEMDVLHQLLFEVLEAGIQRAPGGARLGRRREVVRHRPDAQQVGLVV